MLGTVQVLLQAKALTRLYHDALHLVTLGRFQHRISAPRAANRLRNVNQVGTALFEFFDDLLDLLAAAKRSDQEGIRSIDDEHLVEVNRRDGALGTHHQGVLGAHGNMARVHVVAVFVVRVFAIKAVEATEVAPADIARDHLHLVGLFHDGVVDGIGRDSHHVVAADADGFAVYNFGIGKSLLGSRKHFWGVLAEFSKERLCLETEDTAIPVEVPGKQVLFGGGAVRLFYEALHVFAGGFDVAVTGLGAGRRNAEGHEIARLCEFLGTEQNLLVFILLANHVVRRRHEHDRFRIHRKAGKGNCRGGITAHGFQQELASGHAFGLELVLGQEKLISIRNNKLGFTNGGVGHHRLAEQGLPIKKRSKLLGHQGTAHGPKARTRTTT